MISEVYKDKYNNAWWYKDDKLHREDGPAVEYKDGVNCWYKNGLLHREDGPAMIIDKKNFWYLDGICYGKKKPKNWNKLLEISLAKKLCDL
jgi:hypothetical protein